MPAPRNPERRVTGRRSPAARFFGALLQFLKISIDLLFFLPGVILAAKSKSMEDKLK